MMPKMVQCLVAASNREKYESNSVPGRLWDNWGYLATQRLIRSMFDRHALLDLLGRSTAGHTLPSRSIPMPGCTTLTYR